MLFLFWHFTLIFEFFISTLYLRFFVVSVLLKIFQNLKCFIKLLINIIGARNILLLLFVFLVEYIILEYTEYLLNRSLIPPVNRHLIFNLETIQNHELILNCLKILIYYKMPKRFGRTFLSQHYLSLKHSLSESLSTSNTHTPGSSPHHHPVPFLPPFLSLSHFHRPPLSLFFSASHHVPVLAVLAVISFLRLPLLPLRLGPEHNTERPGNGGGI